jgi:hypothetical protein
MSSLKTKLNNLFQLVLKLKNSQKILLFLPFVILTGKNRTKIEELYCF